MAIFSRSDSIGKHFCRRWFGFLSLVVALMSFVGVADVSAETTFDPTGIVDCRFDAGQGAGTLWDGDFEHNAFPRDDVFRPLLAAPLEPRFSTSWGWSEYFPALGENQTFDGFIYGYAGLGGDAGIWGWRDPETCNGLQLNIFGGGFSQFAINPLHLVNTDYQGGISATIRRGQLSGRLRIYHQSSHLGDDFLDANATFSARTLSFEVVDAVGSVTTSWIRLYVGGGVKVRVEPAETGRSMVRAGLEFRPNHWRFNAPIPSMGMTPIAGVDVVSHQSRDWKLASNTTAGVELVGPTRERRFRLLVALLHGFSPFGVFFDENRTTSTGLEAQFVY